MAWAGSVIAPGPSTFLVLAESPGDFSLARLSEEYGIEEGAFRTKTQMDETGPGGADWLDGGRTASRRFSLRSAALARCSRLAEPPGLSQPPGLERPSVISADFGTGSPVAGGKRSPQTQGAGDRGAGDLCRDAVGLPAVSEANGSSRL